jgi:hypothetical protein
MKHSAGAPVLQFARPSEAHRMLVTVSPVGAMAVTAMIITAGGLLAGAMTSLLSWELPVFILFERALLASLGGAAAWGLARASGSRVPLVPGMQSAFMSMTVWVLGVSVLMLLSRAFGISSGFSWSAGELAGPLAGTRAGLFLLLVLVNLDIVSIATVFVWGKGLSSVWGTSPSFGIRMAWAVYLFAVVLQAVPILFHIEAGKVG